jgi:hypothetical protein
LFWFERIFNGTELSEIKSTRLGTILSRNFPELGNLSSNVLLARSAAQPPQASVSLESFEAMSIMWVFENAVAFPFSFRCFTLEHFFQGQNVAFSAGR